MKKWLEELLMKVKLKIIFFFGPSTDLYRFGWYSVQMTDMTIYIVNPNQCRTSWSYDKKGLITLKIVFVGGGYFPEDDIRTLSKYGEIALISKIIKMEIFLLKNCEILSAICLSLVPMMMVGVEVLSLLQFS